MFHVIRQKDLPPSPNRTIEMITEWLNDSPTT
jgi:hypothetical protein